MRRESKFDPTTEAANAIDMAIRSGLFLASRKSLLTMEKEIEQGLRSPAEKDNGPEMKPAV